jgi:hypothetical protein
LLAPLVTALFALSATGLGLLWPGTGPTRLAQAFSLGLVLWSLLIALLGQLGLLDARIFALLLLGILAGTGRRLLCGLRSLANSLDKWATLYILAVAVCAMAPNTHVDVQIYHYAFPEAYLKQGSLHWTAINVHEGLVGLFQLLYLPLLALGGEAAANLLSPFLLLALVQVCRDLCEGLRPDSGRRAVWLLLSSPLLLFQALGGLVDLACALYSCLALAALLQEREKSPNLPAAALWIGYALAVKWTAALSFVCLVPVAWMRLPAGHKSRAATLFLGLLLLLPQCSRNFANTGDPIYPLTSVWRVGTSKGVSYGGTRRPGGIAPPAVYRFPWRLGSIQERHWQDLPNPLIWLVPLLGLPVLVKRSPFRPLALASGMAFLALCILGTTDLRYCLPSLCWMACLAACVWRGPGWLWGLTCLPGVLTVLALLARIPQWVTPERRADYLAARSPYAAYRFLAERGRSGQFVYLLGRLGYRCPLAYASGDNRTGRPMPPIDFYVADLREPYLIPALLARLANDKQGQKLPIEALRLGPLQALSAAELKKHLQNQGYDVQGDQVQLQALVPPRISLHLEKAFEGRLLFSQDGVVVLSASDPGPQK